MPVYGVTIRGESSPRIVIADTASQARGHVVEAKTLTAVQLAEAVADGATVERAGEVAADPEEKQEEADLGPPLHKADGKK